MSRPSRRKVFARLAAISLLAFSVEWLAFGPITAHLGDAWANVISLFVSGVLAALVIRAHGVRYGDERFLLWSMMLGPCAALMLASILAVLLMAASVATRTDIQGVPIPVGFGLMAVGAVGFVGITSAVVRKGIRDYGDLAEARAFLG